MKITPAQSNWEIKEYVIHAVTESFTSYEIIAHHLKDDEDVLRAALTKCGMPMKHTSSRLKNNREIALHSLQNDKMCFAYQYLSNELKADKEITLAAMKSPTMNLSYASDELKDDKEVVIMAVSHFADALASASDRLRNDKEVVLAAVTKSESSIRFASAEIAKLVFKSNPLEILTKHVNSEKLQEKLQNELTLSPKKATRKI